MTRRIIDIQRIVADRYGMNVADFKGERRARHIARPRQVAIALCRELAGQSYPVIGRFFGGRDHTTIMHACRKVAQLCRDQPGFALQFERTRIAVETELPE